MSLFKYLIITFFSISLIACSEDKNTGFSIKTNAEKQKISNSSSLNLSINNPKSHEITSVTYKLNNVEIEKSVDLSTHTLGTYEISANITYDGKSTIITDNITIVNSESPKIFTYEIVNEYPHDITSYTQGLEFHNGILYESTGQRGESKLRKVDYNTGKILKDINLENDYFGEGLTILNGKIYQLTWESGIGFVYDLETMERLSSFKYGKSNEGWGICNDGKTLYKTDGSERIWTLNPETLTEESFIQACTNKGKMSNINELEWINGKIYANRYQKDGVAIINPKNGAIEGVIDFSPLKKKVTQHRKLDVLNGLAWNPETQTLFVTGKRWDKLFEVRIIEK